MASQIHCESESCRTFSAVAPSLLASGRMTSLNNAASFNVRPPETVSIEAEPPVASALAKAGWRKVITFFASDDCTVAIALPV
mgnify:CR=1 FL=1|jgi:hypothetical protein